MPTRTALTLALLLVAATAPVALYYALALLVCIVLYNLLHKKWTSSLLLMGLCRALVYCVAAAMVASRQTIDLPWTPLAYFAASLTLYIVALTLVAQKEAKGALGYRRWLALFLFRVEFIHDALPPTCLRSSVHLDSAARAASSRPRCAGSHGDSPGRASPPRRRIHGMTSPSSSNLCTLRFAP